MEEIIALDDLCRLCLSAKGRDGSLLLFNITNSMQSKFEELTMKKLPLTDDYPLKVCGDCTDKLEHFYFYKSQLLLKQEQLQTILNEASNLNSFQDLDEIVEEYIDDEDILEVVIQPSVKNLPSTADSETIIRIIDEIAENNEMLLQSSMPQLSARKQKAKEALERPKHKLKMSKVQPVDRKEELKFEVQMPKLIMRPVQPNETHADDDSRGLILYAVEDKCETCNETFKSSLQLKRHQLEFHPLPEPITCCDQVFMFNSEHKKHREAVHPKTMTCPYCSKVLKSRKTLLVHKKSHQNVLDRKFKCNHPQCTKAFNFKLHLENHERTHTGERPFKCQICTASFKQSYQLTMHKKKHEGIINKCLWCNRT